MSLWIGKKIEYFIKMPSVVYDWTESDRHGIYGHYHDTINVIEFEAIAIFFGWKILAFIMLSLYAKSSMLHAKNLKRSFIGFML